MVSIAASFPVIILGGFFDKWRLDRRLDAPLKEPENKDDYDRALKKFKNRGRSKRNTDG